MIWEMWAGVVIMGAFIVVFVWDELKDYKGRGKQ